MSGNIDEVLSEHGCARSVLVTAALVLQGRAAQRDCALVPTEPDLLAIWNLVEKV